MTAAIDTPSRFAPARPSWARLSLLVTLLLIGWAALVPPGTPPQWWHITLAVLLTVAFLGSWHGQHISTTLRRWAPLTIRNRRARRQRAGLRPSKGRRRRPTPDPTPGSDQAPPPVGPTLEAKIVIHLRPQAHALTTAGQHDDQLPWDFITAWLHRYGVQAEELTVCSVTRTPPPSGLRSDAGPLLSGLTPQHRDTWLTYTLRAESNLGQLVARQAPLVSTDDGLQTAGLADTTARRLVAELREQGWRATLCDDHDQLPQFVQDTAAVRREHWTATEYSDGFRAVYAVNPSSLKAVLSTLPTVATKATWVAVTICARGRQPDSLQACVGVLTGTEPSRTPLAGLSGFHGLHHEVVPALTVTGLDDTATVSLPSAPREATDLTELVWATSSVGVPIGYDRNRQPVYLGLASPEAVRITVTGQREFQFDVMARLALSGLPIAAFTAYPQQWARLANNAAREQVSINPAGLLPPGAIVVNDDSRAELPPASMSVTLRRPQTAQPPQTTIVITQDHHRPQLFRISTPHVRGELLSIRA